MFKRKCSALLFTVALSACSGSEPATTSNSTSEAATAAEPAAAAPSVKNLPDPCTLLTQAEVNDATQTQFEAGRSTKMPPEFLGAVGTPLNCSYKHGDQQVSLLIYQGPRPYDTQRGLSGFQKTIEPISGVGDNAFWDTASTSMWTERGDIGLTLQFDRIDKASSDAGKALLLKVLSRVQ